MENSTANDNTLNRVVIVYDSYGTVCRIVADNPTDVVFVEMGEASSARGVEFGSDLVESAIAGETDEMEAGPINLRIVGDDDP